MIAQVLGAFFGVIMVAITFGVPRKFLGYSGLVGAIGWLVYLLIVDTGLSKPTGAFFATLIIALISHSFARIMKTPVTLFLIAGILPLVPGVGMYQIAYNLITNNNSLVVYYFSETMKMAGMIALAIFVMDTIFRMFQKN